MPINSFENYPMSWKPDKQKLDAAMDEIRMKFGNDKITRACIMNSNARIGRKAKAQMKNEKMEEP